MTRFNNPIVVFDLETTNCDNHAIIEVGATALNKELQKRGAWRALVKPDFPVSDFVVELTGHKVIDLEYSPEWPEVAKGFEKWVEQYTGTSLNKVRLAAWGNYFDINVLRNQYKRHNLEYPFSGTVIDVKSVAMLWRALSGKRTDKFSVSSTADDMGIVPYGRYHTAAVDAEVTADIFIRAVGELAGGVWIDKKYIKVTS